MKHITMAKAKPIITLIRKIHLRPILGLATIHSPTGDPSDGPMLADITKNAMACPAPSTSPKRSEMVPATLERAVEPAMPMRNMKMMSIGRLRAYAVP